ncbi:hypothetical protein AB0E62_20175 [Streptomyces sp. NPDC038707]|uniref:hypothetical protein n=1 Tax=Streptomyces sp. NPDC038707 TaxID=3154329 RepID=UPI0033EEEAD0
MTQVLQKRAERERRAAEDLRRWHAEHFRAAKELLYKIKETERILASACASLPNEEGDARLRRTGYTTLLTVRDTDVPQPTDDAMVFDAVHLEIVQEALQQAHTLLEEAEHLTAEISILSEGDTPHAANVMFEAAWDAAGALETTRGTQDAAFRAVIAMQDPIAAFQASVREELGVATPSPHRGVTAFRSNPGRAD